MIKSVQKATKLLTLLADSYEKPLTLAKLAENSGMNKSTCSHIINTLTNEGFAVRISATKGYVLGPAAYCLSKYGRYKDDLVTICRPILQYLYKKLGFCVLLAVIEGSEKYIIDYIDDGSIFSGKMKIMDDSIYRTATGRAIMTNMSDEKVFDIYKKHGNPSQDEWEDVTSLHDLFIKLSMIDKNKVVKNCTKTGDCKIFNIGYGSAIFDKKECVGAIGIAVRINSDEEKSFAETEKLIIKYLQRGAEEISRRISYR